MPLAPQPAALCAFALLAAASFFPAGASASSLERFSQFLAATLSAKGEFEQRIVDRNGKVVQQSKGTLAFSRPGRFRWTYVKPYAQLIVGDGTRVWIYDEDLKQVTVRAVDKALTSTPAALLAGNNEVMRAFRISDQGERDGLEWLQAVPRVKEGGFESLRIGFGFSGPEVMEFQDSFGQTTVLRFTSFQRNPKLDAALFRFSPPRGADVIGDTK
ncbi:MAG: outer membrane lipoprotein chaperone LolA [Betaproteobacteria bacterium]|nr:outer membrane lipoprotein chaperone LolA [Betaproteobacteria bacterium]MBI2958859.1 outer membrane lipoprotein chaperone LolA [Betaproteobacteria bacterium]